MNPINLLLPDGTPSKVWACGECKMVRQDQATATVCCTPAPCSYCGEPTDKKYQHGGCHYHDACWRSNRAKEQMERLEKATKLETWDGWVCADHGPNDGYFESVEAYADWLADEFENPADWPDWVHIAKAKPGVSLDISRILEDLCDDGYDDMGDDFKGTDELSAAINAFNAANKDVIVYNGDYRQAVRVPKPTSVTTPPEDRTDAR